MNAAANAALNRYPTAEYASEADYLAHYFSSPEDMPDTPAALDECKRRAAVYWSPAECLKRREEFFARAGE